MSLPPVRRVVTGHAAGRAVITSDGPTTTRDVGVPDTLFHELWSTYETPVPIDNGLDPTLGGLQLAPPKGGTRIRMVDIPPDAIQSALTPEEASAAFAKLGSPHAVDKEGPHRLMHRTESVDYGIVISGRIWLVVDDGETELGPGDVVIQRGTNHAWSNRTDEIARIAFVLVDGRFTEDEA